jgi:hypothetical protein
MINIAEGEALVRQIGTLLSGAIFFVLSTLLLSSIAPAFADGPQIAQVKTVRGDAFIVRGSERLPAKPGDALFESDVVETGPNGTIGFTFVDNTVFSTGPDSQVALQQFHFDSNNLQGEMQAEMRKGTLSVVSGEITHNSPGAMKIKTPTAILGVRGTTFAVKVY